MERGTRGHGTLPVTTMSTGFKVEVPVHIIAGREPGPTVALIPMLHGHEFSVIDVISEALNRVNPRNLKENIVATTVTNPGLPRAHEAGGLQAGPRTGDAGGRSSRGSTTRTPWRWSRS